MAERPVFVPTPLGAALVQAVPVSFRWHPGMAPVQKKKNVVELHASAKQRGLFPLLEISSKSELEVGRKLSAFHLTIRVDGIPTTVESAFQGSKVFESGGPFTDIYDMNGREAKRDPRLRDSGKLVSFRFEETEFPLSPSTIFYDWLYVNALYQHKDWILRLNQLMGFTDIEFNPEKSINCQARSCATFLALEKRGELDEAVQSFGAFSNAYRGKAI